jgi:hypothetical protein
VVLMVLMLYDAALYMPQPTPRENASGGGNAMASLHAHVQLPCSRTSGSTKTLYSPPSTRGESTSMTSVVVLSARKMSLPAEHTRFRASTLRASCTRR